MLATFVVICERLRMLRSILPLLSLTVISAVAAPETKFDPATTATNQLGLELFRALAADTPEGNLLISPYSIQSALTLAYAGAAGETRKEMAKVLHFPDDDTALQSSFSALRQAFDRAATDIGLNQTSFELRTANRLYAQLGFPIRESFVTKLMTGYSSTVEGLDFKKQPDESRMKINQWVEGETRSKIRDLIPAGGVKNSTRLVLVNALYFKSAWEVPFESSETKILPFHLLSKDTVEVATMHQSTIGFGYAKFRNFVTVTLPYFQESVQLVILLPNKSVSLDALAKQLTPATLRKLAPELINENNSEQRPEIDLSLPRFKIDGFTISLAQKLQGLGMKSAFDLPKKTANFDGIYPLNPPDDYLALSGIFHRTYLALDEEGTEAAAATAEIVAAAAFGVDRRKPPKIKVQVDRPFLFMIQHCESGACLFLGRVTDPR